MTDAAVKSKKTDPLYKAGTGRTKQARTAVPFGTAVFLLQASHNAGFFLAGGDGRVQLAGRVVHQQAE